MAAMGNRSRRPLRVTVGCVELLEQAGMVPAAIADELGISDSRLAHVQVKPRQLLQQHEEAA
jgi:hypothetical protein